MLQILYKYLLQVCIFFCNFTRTWVKNTLALILFICSLTVSLSICTFTIYERAIGNSGYILSKILNINFFSDIKSIVYSHSVKFRLLKTEAYLLGIALRVILNVSFLNFFISYLDHRSNFIFLLHSYFIFSCVSRTFLLAEIAVYEYEALSQFLFASPHVYVKSNCRITSLIKSALSVSAEYELLKTF